MAVGKFTIATQLAIASITRASSERNRYLRQRSILNHESSLLIDRFFAQTSSLKERTEAKIIDDRQNDFHQRDELWEFL